MPTFGLNKNVMCFVDDIYVYPKARASGSLGRARPARNTTLSPGGARDATTRAWGLDRRRMKGRERRIVCEE